ncbi:MAG TPA: aliphatic sulfonate ABC transporter substrate-binding protein, partial [Dissulfurispiraceae bacterium]|nr:aliphatic sulfonate ABC transporter substrate-binding protein [Dissulfurispiraceae bacterium]
MAFQLNKEVIDLLADEQTVKVLATTDANGIPHAVVKQSVHLGESGNLVFFELIESARTNRNLVRSIWFDGRVSVTLIGKGGQSYQITGKPVKVLVAGPAFQQFYLRVREQLGDVDLAAVWIIEPEEVRNQDLSTRIAVESAAHPNFIHLDRLAKAKTVLLFFLALLTGLIMAARPGLASTYEIRIATQPAPFDAPIFVARQKKWVEEELAKAGSPAVKWTSFSAGPPMNESFAAGQQDIGFLGDTPAIIARSAGIDILIVGKCADGPKALAVVVPANSSIKFPKDLKGKKIAVTKGSYAHHLLVLVLRKGDLTTKDIDLINLSQADIATAIANGNIDGAAIWDPLISKLVSQGIVRVLADGSGIKKGVLVIVASNDYLAKHT